MPTIIDLNITRETRTPSQKDFGVPMVFGFHTHFAERSRTYEEADDLLEDGFTTSDPIYIEVAAIKKQEPSPPEVKVGRRLGAPTRTLRWIPTDLTEGRVYSGKLNGKPWTYTVPAAAALATVLAGVETVITALGEAVATDDTSGTHLDITASVVGAYFRFSDLVGPHTLADRTAVPATDLPTDLAGLYDEDSAWYGLIIADAKSKDQILDAAAWVETKTALYLGHSTDTDVPNNVAGNVRESIQALGYERTVLLYNGASQELGPDGAWTGLGLAQPAGSITWALKRPKGVAADALTTTQQNNVASETNFGNLLLEDDGNVYTWEGRVASGEYIDIIHGTDWLHERLRVRALTPLLSLGKVPYTNPGALVIESEIWAALKEATAGDRLLLDPTSLEVTRIPVEQMAAADRGNRHYPGYDFKARYQGAFHRIGIRGRIGV